jgi:Acetyltransferase (GNAT) family
MAEPMRHATLMDLLSIVATRRRQRVLRLNPPYTILQPDALLPDLLRSQIPVKPQVSFIYVYREGHRVVGYVQARCRWRRRDEWTITALGLSEKAPDRVAGALLEEVCRAAGEEGVIRLFVKVPADEPQAAAFRRLGFTQYTTEHIWGNLYVSQTSPSGDEPDKGPVRRQRNQDAWDLMQLYTSVSPPAVQRAEALNSRQWQMSRIPRPWFLSQGMLENAYVWPDQTPKALGLGGYVRLLTGSRGHWLTMLFRPDMANRLICPPALDYALRKASRFGAKPVYFGCREYQEELGGLLEDRGFHLLSEQALLVKYLAEPIKEWQPALVPFLVPQKGGEPVPPKV